MLRNKMINFTYTAYLRNCSESDFVKLIKIKRNQRSLICCKVFIFEIAKSTVVVRKTIFKNINFERNLKYGEDIFLLVFFQKS